MSKAFTRESDDTAPEPEVVRPPSLLPEGAKNYLTPGGAARMREELTRLIESERPAAAARADDLDGKRHLRQLDDRIQQLQQTLQSAEIVPPPTDALHTVRFGAAVTIREEDGSEVTYRIVGVDEADPGRGSVSWLSPIARALLNARVGDRVRFQFPSGEEELVIVRVMYE